MSRWIICPCSHRAIRDVLTTGLGGAANYIEGMAKEVQPSGKTAVLYNAECPVCNFEITHYEKYASSKNLPIRFDDLNGQAREQWDLTEDEAARRLYVTKDGALHAGIPAFLILWEEMPRYRLLANVIGLPIIRQVASFVYDYALAPAIYHWHLARKRKRAQAN